MHLVGLPKAQVDVSLAGCRDNKIRLEAVVAGPVGPPDIADWGTVAAVAVAEAGTAVGLCIADWGFVAAEPSLLEHFDQVATVGQGTGHQNDDASTRGLL